MRIPVILVAAATLTASAMLAAPASARDLTIIVSASGFTPAAGTIDAGDRVRFVSGDAKPHQISKTGGPDGGQTLPDVLDARGKLCIIRISAEGTYTYVDRLGGGTFRVVVKPSALSKR